MHPAAATANGKLQQMGAVKAAEAEAERQRQRQRAEAAWRRQLQMETTSLKGGFRKGGKKRANEEGKKMPKNSP